MRNRSFFRRKLAHRLRRCAACRRLTCAGDASGDDLALITLFDRLACEAERMPQTLVDEVVERCADPAFARRFESVWDGLPDLVGVLWVPDDAADLVRSMVRYSRHDLLGTTPQCSTAELGSPVA